MKNTAKNGRYEVGNVLQNNYGTYYKIIEKLDNPFRRIIFLDEFSYEKIVTTSNMSVGNCKNPYDKTMCGIGYMGECDKVSKEIYSKWASILQRCYSEKCLNNKPTYKNVTVCEEWLCFKNFQNWYIDTYPKNINNPTVDKDLLQFRIEHKIYSPKTCIWVTNEINNLIKNLENSSYIYKTDNGYQVSFEGGKSRKYFKSYDDSKIFLNGLYKNKIEKTNIYLNSLDYLEKDLFIKNIKLEDLCL